MDLFTAFCSKSSGNRAEIIKAVANSDDIQLYWTILSPVEEHAIRLLEEIVGLHCGLLFGGFPVG